MNFDMNLVVNSFPLLLIGAGVTIQITVLSTAIGFVIGLVVGVARISHLRPLRLLAEVYVEFFRGTPLLVQIFLFYFALPVITGQRIDPFIAAISACGINSGAYVAEIFRAGIQSVDEGQMEAGRSLGMTWLQTMRYIIVPQAFKRVIPPLGNEFIAMLKDSSLVSVIGFEELTRRTLTVSLYPCERPRQFRADLATALKRAYAYSLIRRHCPHNAAREAS